MFLTNDKTRVIKHYEEMLTVTPDLIEKVAHFAGCSVEDVIKSMDKHFPDNENESPSIQDLIARKAKELTNK